MSSGEENILTLGDASGVKSISSPCFFSVMEFPSPPMLCRHRHLAANRASPVADCVVDGHDVADPLADYISDHTVDRPPHNYVAFCAVDGCPDGGHANGGEVDGGQADANVGRVDGGRVETPYG